MIQLLDIMADHSPCPAVFKIPGICGSAWSFLLFIYTDSGY